MSRNSSAVSGPIPAILVLTDSSRQCPGYNRPIFQNFSFRTVQFRKFHCQKQILRRMHFFKIFFGGRFFGKSRYWNEKKKQYFNKKKSTFWRCGFCMDQDLERWLSLLIWCNTTTQIAVDIKNFVNQSLNLASVPLPKVLRFIFTEKGTSSMQASQGLRISIKDCCNSERISGLAFSIFTGDQTFLQWTNKRVIVSIITNPRAWSKTMGIASNSINWFVPQWNHIL